MVIFYMLQTGYTDWNTVIYSCLTTVKTHFLNFSTANNGK